MNVRKQVLEVELKTVRILGLSTNPELAQAAIERERELSAELQLARDAFPSPRAPEKEGGGD